ncbi:hypothetical protein FOXG_20264 [Fusarium oxysporum f. sp. lycopersici 4287]|uniref:Uncharacterized protein n=1 Tax=Fusarium oxysporum f. sp. lycopersici (strain 4287 / CBS 123668 / FGSC 9935 / NRRL 34936) TaxID=426428 RepID=A0A0J9WPX6_FUSO4|nr:hypothetical protein FOXG_20264 [Fusarium oxysporum f. sp. lycopersici 4287]KNB09797.1 hypothetical protein FOXG_20264 [Fusarium oxysporum f. sp. lycopersici 4287]
MISLLRRRLHLERLELVDPRMRTSSYNRVSDDISSSSAMRTLL